MTRSPLVEFGLFTLNTAYQARAGRCGPWDVVRLQDTAMWCVWDDADALALIRKFTGNVRGDAFRAGSVLSQDFIAWRESKPADVRNEITTGAAVDRCLL